MKRFAGWILCVWLAAPVWAQNGPPVDDKIDTPLEYFFGALALIALVMTWLWLWLKTKQSLKQMKQDMSQRPDAPVDEET